MILVNDNSVDSINTALLKLKEEFNSSKNQQQIIMPLGVASSHIGQCNTAASDQRKTVIFPDKLTVEKGLTIGVFFRFSNFIENPLLLINNSAYAIKVNNSSCGKGIWDDNSFHVFIFDGNFFQLVDNGGIIEQIKNLDAGYTKYSDGRVEQWIHGLKNFTRVETIHRLTLFSGSSYVYMYRFGYNYSNDLLIPRDYINNVITGGIYDQNNILSTTQIITTNYIYIWAYINATSCSIGVNIDIKGHYLKLSGLSINNLDLTE